MTTTPFGSLLSSEYFKADQRLDRMCRLEVKNAAGELLATARHVPFGIRTN